MGDKLAVLAGILLIAAMLMPSTRLLRWFALGAGVCATAHFAMAGGQNLPLALAILFVLVNAVQLVLLIGRSRAQGLSDEERELLEHVLKVEEPDQQRRLRDLLEWRDAAVGETLMHQGEASPPLVYVASGTGRIEVDGKAVGSCTQGDFLGEMSVILGDKATASVVVAETMRIARFDRDALAEMSRKLPELRRAFDHALNRGLAAKIVRMNESAAQDS